MAVLSTSAQIQPPYRPIRATDTGAKKLPPISNLYSHFPITMDFFVVHILAKFGARNESLFSSLAKHACKYGKRDGFDAVQACSLCPHAEFFELFVLRPGRVGPPAFDFHNVFEPGLLEEALESCRHFNWAADLVHGLGQQLCPSKGRRLRR